MEILTDIALRAHWFRSHEKAYHVSKDTMLTPAARDFIREHGITLIYEDSALEGQPEVEVSSVPESVKLAAYPTSYIMRLMRSSMLDVLGQDYMRTAKAKGLSQKVSLFKHALRNAILPVITYVGPMLAYTLTGSFVTEKIFTIPGLGGEFIKAINGRDYTMIMGTTIFLATIMIVMNVIVDIVYKLVDPRIKLK